MTRIPPVLMSLVMIAGVTLAVFKILPAYRQSQAIADIRNKGGTVYTDGNLVDRLLWDPPVFYVDLSGQHITADVALILLCLPSFEVLYLDEASLDDTAVNELCRMPDLKVLTLYDATVTEDGVNRLRTALANCEICSGARPNDRR